MTQPWHNVTQGGQNGATGGPVSGWKGCLGNLSGMWAQAVPNLCGGPRTGGSDPGGKVEKGQIVIPLPVAWQ